jgi:hypothetical protein
MSKKHFFLYDIFLPLGFILIIGRILTSRFDTLLFQNLDQMRAFGIGEWLIHSPSRNQLFELTWVFFGAIPTVFWLIWVAVNIERDWVSGRRRLDRPIFNFFKGLFDWIEGEDQVRLVTLAYERRLASAEERIHRIKVELDGAHAALIDLEDDDEEAIN